MGSPGPTVMHRLGSPTQPGPQEPRYLPSTSTGTALLRALPGHPTAALPARKGQDLTTHQTHVPGCGEWPGVCWVSGAETCKNYKMHCFFFPEIAESLLRPILN